VRLQKFLARAGVASRRYCEELIEAGAVRVNGIVVRAPGTSIVDGDRVEVGQRPVEISPERQYVVLHKPAKVMTTMRDPEGRRTVAGLVPRNRGRLVPVGRLDYDTSGVLLMTDDGALAHVLTHPRFGIEKTYRAVVRGRLKPAEVERILGGVRLDDGPSTPAKLRVVRTGAGFSEVDLTIHEGRNRQVRRTFEVLGHRVMALTRLRFGPLALGDLPPGRWREANAKEIAALLGLLRAAERGRAEGRAEQGNSEDPLGA
jgi:23S rRNA pseudouridine2605 synthase